MNRLYDYHGMSSYFPSNITKVYIIVSSAIVVICAIRVKLLMEIVIKSCPGNCHIFLFDEMKYSLTQLLLGRQN